MQNANQVIGKINLKKLIDRNRRIKKRKAYIASGIFFYKMQQTNKNENQRICNRSSTEKKIFNRAINWRERQKNNFTRCIGRHLPAPPRLR